jgi:hypothetical protein
MIFSLLRKSQKYRIFNYNIAYYHDTCNTAMLPIGGARGQMYWSFCTVSDIVAVVGEVAERLMAPLSKSGSRLCRDVGSNPTLSAKLGKQPVCE